MSSNHIAECCKESIYLSAWKNHKFLVLHLLNKVDCEAGGIQMMNYKALLR